MMLCCLLFIPLVSKCFPGRTHARENTHMHRLTNAQSMRTTANSRTGGDTVSGLQPVPVFVRVGGRVVCCIISAFLKLPHEEVLPSSCSVIRIYFSFLFDVLVKMDVFAEVKYQQLTILRTKKCSGLHQFFGGVFVVSCIQPCSSE